MVSHTTLLERLYQESQFAPQADAQFGVKVALGLGLQKPKVLITTSIMDGDQCVDIEMDDIIIQVVEITLITIGTE